MLKAGIDLLPTFTQLVNLNYQPYTTMSCKSRYLIHLFSVFAFLCISWSAISQNDYADSILKIAPTEEDNCERCFLYRELAWENLYEDSDTAEYYAREAIKAGGHCDDLLQISNSYTILANTFLVRNMSTEALKYYFTALPIKEQIQDSIGISSIYTNIGITYRYLNDFENALIYYQKGLEYTIGLGKDPSLDYHNISLCYNQTQKYELAIVNELKALNGFLAVEDTSEAIDCYIGLGLNYQAIDSIDQALYNYNLAEELSEKYDRRVASGDLYVNMAGAYRLKGNPEKALIYAQKGLELTKESDKSLFDWHKNALKEMSKINAQLGRMEEAYRYHVQYVQLKDSLLNEEKIREAAEKELTYVYEKEQFEDSLIHIQEIRQEQLKTENQKKLNVLFLILGGLLFITVIVVAVAYRNKRKSNRIISEEKQRSEELLLNILPSETAEELKAQGYSKPKPYDQVTVLFTDFKGFTMIAEKLSAEELVSEIDYCFKAFDEILGKYSIEKIKTIGDAYMCVGGLPTANQTHPRDVVNAAIDIRDWMLNYYQERKNEGRIAFEIRIGVHTGPVVAGIVGLKKFAYDIWGDTVNTAARMESSGAVGKVNVSGYTRELLTNNFDFEHRGKIEAKNKGYIDMYFAERK